MGDMDTRERGAARPPEQPAVTSTALSSIAALDAGAQARSLLLEGDPRSRTLLARVRALPAMARAAIIGLAAIGVVVSGAAALRGRETLDALEAAAMPRSARTVAHEGAKVAPVSSAAPHEEASTRAAGSASAVPIAPATSDALRDAPGGSGAGASSGDGSQGSDSARAQVAELTAARAKGIPGLEALLHSYPRDPDVLKALLSAYTRQRSHAAALNIAERLLDAAPRAAEEAEVQQAIVFVVNGPVDVSADALRLLSTKMGTRGPDLLYEIVSAPRMGKLPKERAAERLRDAAVRARSTPALLVALDLRNTTPCARKPLYQRAREVGDARSLVFLKPMTSTEGCGILRRSDCFSCLEPRKDLLETVAAIQKRLEQGPLAGGQ